MTKQHLVFTCALATVISVFSIAAGTLNAQQMELSVMQAVSYDKDKGYQVKAPRSVFKESVENVRAEYITFIRDQYGMYVPRTGISEQKYQVRVPFTENVQQADGSSKQITKYRTEIKTRQVPVTEMPYVPKTTPVRRMRSGVETRLVPYVFKSSKTNARDWLPPKGASFFTTDGASISSSELRERIQARQVDIVTLPAGQELTKFHRTILHPDVVLMTSPKVRRSRVQHVDDAKLEIKRLNAKLKAAEEMIKDFEADKKYFEDQRAKREKQVKEIQKSNSK